MKIEYKCKWLTTDNVGNKNNLWRYEVYVQTGFFVFEGGALVQYASIFS